MVPCSKSTEVDVVKKFQGTLGLSGWTAIHRSVTKKTVSGDGKIIIMIVTCLLLTFFITEASTL